MKGPTQRDKGLEGEDWRPLWDAIQGQIVAFGGQPYDTPPTSFALGRPGSKVVDRSFQGDGTHDDRVLHIQYSQQNTFLSTDRAAILPRRRPPVSDTYTFLLSPKQSAGASFIKDVHIKRRLIPEALALSSMANIEAHPAYRDALSSFEDHPYATRLSDRPLATPPRPRGLLRRLLSPPPPSDPPMPERQVKWTLERWLPPGTYNFGDIFDRVREGAPTIFTSTDYLLAWTIEFWEMPGPRYVHWHFHGTLLRVIENPKNGQILASERFRTG